MVTEGRRGGDELEGVERRVVGQGGGGGVGGEPGGAVRGVGGGAGGRGHCVSDLRLLGGAWLPKKFLVKCAQAPDMTTVQ